MSNTKLSTRMKHTRESARKRGKDFNLTYEYLANIMAQEHCAYSGEKFGTGEECMSLERWDNDKGYVIGNVVPVKRKYNTMRGDLTLEQLLIASNNKAEAAKKLDKPVKPSGKARGYMNQKQGIEGNIKHRREVLEKMKADYERTGNLSILEHINAIDKRITSGLAQIAIYEKLIDKEMKAIKEDPKNKVKTAHNASLAYDMIAKALLKFEYMSAHNYVRLKRGLPMIHKEY